MPTHKDSIVWCVLPGAADCLDRVRGEYASDQEYRDDREALKEFICLYIDTSTCQSKQGKSISPMGSTPGGGKILKIRWRRPGQGKSGSLRLIAVAFCDARKIKFACAYLRKTEPTDAEVADAAKSSDR